MSFSEDTISTVYGKFPSKYTVKKLSEICTGKNGVQTGPFGSQLHKTDYVENGTPIVTVEHLGENRLLHANLPGVSDVDKERLAKYVLQEGDIVFSRVGSVDRRAYVSKDEDGWLFSGRCLRVRPNEDIIDGLYLSYFFGLPKFKEHIRNIAVGATMPSINTKILSDINIAFPEIPIQKNIVSILRTIDDKIQTNNQVNKTLEEIAQTIFKHWFLDFEFPNEDGQPYKSSGGKMVESELGMIPEEWEVKPIADVLDFVIGGDWGKKDKDTTFAKTTYCIRGADFPDIYAGNTGDIPLRFLKESSFKKRQLKHGDIVLEISGGTKGRPTGRTIYIEKGLAETYKNSLVFSNFCRVLRCNNSIKSSILYCFLQYLYKIGIMETHQVQSTGIANFQFKRFTETQLIVVPGPGTQVKFDDIISKMFEKKYNIENGVLKQLRDILLPKLMSGEIIIES
jgi:type I restriction enzyme S subunit